MKATVVSCKWRGTWQKGGCFDGGIGVSLNSSEPRFASIVSNNSNQSNSKKSVDADRGDTNGAFAS